MKAIIISLSALFIIFGAARSQEVNQFQLSEDGRLQFLGLAAKYGHPANEVYIITEDGYNLTLFHIPGERTRPVLLVHGNTPTADCWVLRGHQSLGLTLSERGYDVWAVDLRGSRYSRRHVSINPDERPDQYFNYTFYEQGVFDLPPTIDYILKETNQRQLIVVAHSMSTTSLYILGAEKPEYNSKIKLAIMLAPIGFHQNTRGAAAYMKNVNQRQYEILSSTNPFEIGNHDKTEPILRILCLQPLGYKWCIQNFIFPLMGYDERGFEPAFLNTVVGHWPGGMSTKSLRHLRQFEQRNKIAHYDYGAYVNLKVYGMVEPPDFDLKKVSMRIAMLVGREDYISTEADAVLLKAALPNVVHYKVLPYMNFNHIDFIWGRHMDKYLYPYLLPLIENYTYSDESDQK